MNVTDLAASLRFVRGARELTQENVSEQTKVARSTINRIEGEKIDLSKLQVGTVETLTRWIAGTR